MSPIFLSGFETTLISMLRIVFVAIFAGILVKKRFISNRDIDALSRVTIHVFLPCLILTAMITKLDPSIIPHWWLLPLASFVMNLMGLLFGWLLFGGRLKGNRELIAMGGIQNSVYLVLPVGQTLFPQHFDLFAAICFLFVMGNSPIHWTLGLALVSQDGKMDLKKMMNLPLMATFVGVFMALTGTGQYIPDTVMDAARLLGSATIPLATFILGATLGEVRLANLPPVHKLIRVIGAKFVLVPLVTWAVVASLGLYDAHPLLATLFMIQAAAAPATNLILQARAHGGKAEFMGGAMIVCYLACLLAIPFWVAIATPL